MDLFNNIKEITNVEYTHGSKEMGADIILNRNDSVLGVEEYIAIVAKAVPIKQDFTDVQRQIEECYLFDITIESGKKKVQISEVWVVCSKNITSNAQEKIYAIFKDKKVKFIGVDILIKLIDEHFSDFWNSENIQMFQYFKKLKDKIMEIDKNSQIIPQENYFYINQDVQLYKLKGDNKILRAKKRKKINIFDEVIASKISIIDGGAGFGKPKMMRNIALYYASEQKYNETHIIPIFCSFTEFIKKYEKDINFLIKNTGISNTPSDTFLFLIDAVDEIGISCEDTDQLLYSCIDLFNSFDSDYRIHVVFSMRYPPISTNTNAAIASVQCYRIEALTLSKTIEFLKRVCVHFDFTRKFIEDMKKSSLFKEIPKSPIAALLLAKIVSENINYDLPSTMTELYSKYTEIALGRWDIDKGLKKEIEYTIHSNFIMYFVYFISNDGNSVEYEALLHMLEDYLVKRNLEGEFDAKQLLDDLIYKSDLLSIDQGNGACFRHRTFFEFFYAKYAKEKDSLQIDNKIFEQFWSNIYYFYIGLQNDCPMILDKIIEIYPSSEAERWGKIFFSGMYFLAAFMTPYEHTEKYIPSIFIEAANLYAEIVTKKIDSPFSVFPQEILLFFIQSILIANYSYNFFKKAILSACVHIDDSEIDENIKIKAIFFLALVSNELGSEDILDFLIKKYCHKLNIDILVSLDIGNNINKSDLIKKASKRLHSMAKGPQNKQFKLALKELFNLAIKDIPSHRIPS